jgi:hypothetical protein
VTLGLKITPFSSDNIFVKSKTTVKILVVHNIRSDVCCIGVTNDILKLRLLNFVQT